MSASEKIAAVFQLNQMLWNTTEAHERSLHPEADDREIFLRVAHRLDRETMLRVYGWYPPEEGSQSKASPHARMSEKNVIVRFKSGEVQPLKAEYGIEDDTEGYIWFFNSNGEMVGLFHKPVVERWEERPEGSS
jgi:hypothetical protein